MEIKKPGKSKVGRIVEGVRQGKESCQQVKIGLEAPREISILRSELLEEEIP